MQFNSHNMPYLEISNKWFILIQLGYQNHTTNSIIK